MNHCIEEESSQELYNKFILPHVNNETIPISLISMILSYYFKSHHILHAYKETHLIIKVPLHEFLNAPINNWEHNRPPDNLRCQDIARSIYNSNNSIDSMFYLSYNNILQTFDILDGIHRYTALKIIERENKVPINILTPGDFGGNNNASWLFESCVILNMRFNTSIGELIHTFQTVNKSHPVSELYIRDINRERRTIIENICERYQKKYGTHFSSSLTPQIPNVNRGKFVDLLDQLYDKYKINEINKDKLDDLLDNMNIFIASNIPRKITKKALDKCTETGCWLFLYRTDKLLEII
jgi:hypothetical protein